MDSGLAVLATDSVSGRKQMQLGQAFAGQKLYDIMGHFCDPVILDENGSGEFCVDGGSVSVWVTENAYRRICTEIVV